MKVYLDTNMVRENKLYEKILTYPEFRRLT